MLYKMIDSFGYDSIFAHSSNPDSAQWRVTFTEVGIGNGNYILTNSVSNGRVYAWVEPRGGIPAGEYAPIKILYAPKQKQMVTFGGEYQFDERSRIDFESAISQ